LPHHQGTDLNPTPCRRGFLVPWHQFELEGRHLGKLGPINLGSLLYLSLGDMATSCRVFKSTLLDNFQGTDFDASAWPLENLRTWSLGGDVPVASWEQDSMAPGSYQRLETKFSSLPI